jgi:hypothetical protein
VKSEYFYVEASQIKYGGFIPIGGYIEDKKSYYVPIMPGSLREDKIINYEIIDNILTLYFETYIVDGKGNIDVVMEGNLKIEFEDEDDVGGIWHYKYISCDVTELIN